MARTHHHWVVLLAVLAGSLGCADLGTPIDDFGYADGASEQGLFVDKENIWAKGQNGNVCFIVEGGGAIRSALADACLGAGAGTDGSDNEIYAAKCSGTDEQHWTVGDDGTLQIFNKCLNVSAGEDGRGPQMNLRHCNRTTAQQWKLKSVTAEGQSGYMLVHVETGYCLHNLGGTDPGGGDVQLGNCNESEAQRWTLPNTVVSPKHQRAMRDAVANSWTAVSEMRFDHWGPCTDDLDPSTTVAIQSRRGEGEGTGRDSNGRRVVTMDLSSSTNQTDLRGTFVHEMGHVLGFAHEQGRLENRFSQYCDSFQGGSWDTEINHPSDWTKTTTYGVFDPASVVSYCVRGNTQMMLSHNDILGAQHYYGKRSFRRVLWSSRSSRPLANRVAAGESPLTLTTGERWASRDRKVALVLEPDGQLAVRRLDLSNFGPLWTSGTKATHALAEFGSDGILRVRNRATTVWQSTTTPYPGATLTVQHDGNVVIKDADGEVRWSTDTEHRDELEGAVGLIPGAHLSAGEHKDTRSGRFRLEMQTDGNLVVYDRWSHSARVWSSDTSQLGAQTAKMMLDGTLALLDGSGKRVWTVNFAGQPGAFLALQEDGNLVAYEPSKFLVWSAGEMAYDDDDDDDSETREPTFDTDPVMLWHGSSIAPGATITSTSGRSKLMMQSDGDLALSVTATPKDRSPQWVIKWESKTQSAPAGRARLEDNGALRVYSTSGKVLFDSDTSNYMNSYLTFNDSGRVMIYRVVTVGADGIGFTY